MDLGSAIKLLLRRWLVVLLGVVLTAGAGAYLYTQTPPSYQASARLLLLLPPNARGAELDGSPYLYLPNGLNVLAGVVAVIPQDRQFRADLVSQGFVSSYSVGVDPHTPALTVSVEGPDPDNVIATRDALVTSIQEELERVQLEERTPRRQTAHARVYAAEDVPQELGGSGIRGLLALAAVGGLLTLLAAFAVDRLLAIRRARRDRKGNKNRRKGRRKGRQAKRDSLPDNGDSTGEGPDGDPEPNGEVRPHGDGAPDDSDPHTSPATPPPGAEPAREGLAASGTAAAAAVGPRRDRQRRRRARPRLTRKVPAAVRARRARHSAYLPDAPEGSDSP